MDMFHFLKAFWQKLWMSKQERRYLKLQSQSYVIAEKVFYADNHIRKRLISQEYKNTPTWQNSRKKRMVLGYIPMAIPVVAVLMCVAIDLISVKPVTDIIFDTMTVFGLTAVFLWPLGIITLKHQIHNAKIIPENRLYDTLAFKPDWLDYTFFNRTTGYEEMYRIRYKDISIMSYSVKRHTLYLFGGYSKRILSIQTKVKTVLDTQSFPKDRGLYVDIPMYYIEQEGIRKHLINKTGLRIQTIEPKGNSDGKNN